MEQLQYIYCCFLRKNKSLLFTLSPIYSFILSVIICGPIIKSFLFPGRPKHIFAQWFFTRNIHTHIELTPEVPARPQQPITHWLINELQLLLRWSFSAELQLTAERFPAGRSTRELMSCVKTKQSSCLFLSKMAKTGGKINWVFYWINRDRDRPFSWEVLTFW